MGLPGRSFGGDERKMTAEVACLEGRCEEKDDGIETGEVGPWDTQAPWHARLAVARGTRGDGGGGGAAPRVTYTGRSALGLGWSWVVNVRYGMGSDTAGRTPPVRRRIDHASV